MNPLELVGLTHLMKLSSGRSEIRIGLVDGPVAVYHPDLAGDNILDTSGKRCGGCVQSTSIACNHGTFPAGILCARRDSPAPAICPDCTLLVRPIFEEPTTAKGVMPSSTSEALAEAIFECIEAGVHVLNLSVGLAQLSSRSVGALEDALDYATSRRVIVVAAAGNQGMLGSSVITRHQSVIPVAACNPQGRPVNGSNLGLSIGRRGLRAPGVNITSLGADGKPLTRGGTSVAACFASGAIALLWSLVPNAKAAAIRFALTQSRAPRRTTVVPPLLNAWAAYQALAEARAQAN